MNVTVSYSRGWEIKLRGHIIPTRKLILKNDLKLIRVRPHNPDTTKAYVMTAYFLHLTHRYFTFRLIKWNDFRLNTLRTGEADLRFYITTVQDG